MSKIFNKKPPNNTTKPPKKNKKLVKLSEQVAFLEEKIRMTQVIAERKGGINQKDEKKLITNCAKLKKLEKRLEFLQKNENE